MKKLFALASALVLSFSNAYAAMGTYELDSSHTNILFFINHLGFSDYMGRFTDYSGTVVFDEEKPENSMMKVTIKPASVVSASPKLDGELAGADYFNTEKFPTATFESTKVEVTGKSAGKVTGNFTFLGVTKPLMLDVALSKCGYFPMTGYYVCGFSATGSFKRSEFGMTKLVPLVSDEVKIHINTEMVDKNNVQKTAPEKK